MLLSNYAKKISIFLVRCSSPCLATREAHPENDPNGTLAPWHLQVQVSRERCDSMSSVTTVLFVPLLRVSSVLNKDVKQFGKRFMFDGQNDTCWNSDQVKGGIGPAEKSNSFTPHFAPF